MTLASYITEGLVERSATSNQKNGEKIMDEAANNVIGTSQVIFKAQTLKHGYQHMLYSERSIVTPESPHDYYYTSVLFLCSFILPLPILEFLGGGGVSFACTIYVFVHYYRNCM